MARILLKVMEDEGTAPFQYWKTDLYRHTGTHWELCHVSELNQWLFINTERAYYLKTVKGAEGAYDWSPDRTKISDLRFALSDMLLLRRGEAESCMAFQNGVYNLKTEKIDPHSPSRFNLTSLPFSYDKEAECPQWLGFLESILPCDPEAQGFLQEWIGYVLSGRTDLHKMVSLVGPRRCGKGTIARIMEALLGSQAMASPTMQQMAGQFGRENLIGKSLAMFSDVKWHTDTMAEAVPHLLAISGMDAVDVPRKNRQDWHGTLGTRFMFMSNDEPNYRDPAGALSERMLQVQFRQSFAGKEDPALTHKLTSELPGIMNWALAGLKRLSKRGYLVQPASADELADNVRRAAAPYGAFADDCCEIVPEGKVTISELLTAYGRWAASEGRDRDRPSKSSLSKGLRAYSTAVTSKRRNLDNGLKETDMYGIRLRPALETKANEPPTDQWLASRPDQQPIWDD